jgi:hypothetical protein
MDGAIDRFINAYLSRGGLILSHSITRFSGIVIDPEPFGAGEICRRCHLPLKMLNIESFRVKLDGTGRF